MQQCSQPLPTHMNEHDIETKFSLQNNIIPIPTEQKAERFFQRAESYSSQKEFLRAITLCHEAVALSPHSRIYKEALARTYIACGDHALQHSRILEARQCYEQALTLYRELGHVMGTGEAYYKLGRNQPVYYLR